MFAQILNAYLMLCGYKWLGVNGPVGGFLEMTEFDV